MNWKRIVKLALTLLIAQAVIRILDGALSPENARIAWHAARVAVSFVACGAIFAMFAMRQPTKPLTHALIALLFQGAAAFLVLSALDRWFGETSWLLVALEWQVLTCALVVGTSAGSAARHSFGKPADA